MTSRWVAERLDRACIELAIRPTLPAIDGASKFPRLRLAEERTKKYLTDDLLFPELAAPKHTVVQSRMGSGNRRELTISWAGPSLDLEQSWFADTPRVVRVKSNWYLRTSPRPLVVLIRGWTPLANLSSRVLWPLRQLDQVGYDVVIPDFLTGIGPSQNAILSRDPSRNIVELARATTILEQVLMVARELGHESVVVWGTSLGAHLVALLATRRLAAHANLYVLEKPLGRLSDPLRLHGRGTNIQRDEVANRLDRVYLCVSPLDRPLRVDAKNIVIIGGDYDQITPISGAQLLADHFGVPLLQIAASHLFDPRRVRRVLEILQRNAKVDFSQPVT